VSNLRDGAYPPTEGAARKKRRRRRSRQRVPAIAGKPGPLPGNGGTGVPFSASTGNMPTNAAGSKPQGTGQAHSPRNRRRRNRHKSRAGSANGIEPALRNMRAPVVPVPDVRYDPAATGIGVPLIPRFVARAGLNGSDGHVPVRGGAFAALDLGTNNCRLLIAVPTRNRRIRVIDAFSRIVRLGEGLAASGRLDEGAMERALDALRICAAKLASHRIAARRLIATEACRQAENGGEFLARVRDETGLLLEIVDRETEARLAAEGCGELMDRRAEGALLFDIGGGSSELVLVNRNLSRSQRISSQIAGWTSLPLGVVTLAERHGGRSVSRGKFNRMVEEVTEHLDAFEGRGRLADIWAPGRTHLLGTSGTVTTIAGVHLALPRYDRRQVDGIWLSDKQVDKVIGDLLDMDYEMRAKNPCIGRERADLVLAGCAILEAIRRIWPSDRLRVADRGLREGMLCELMERAGVWPRRGRKGRGGNGQAEAGQGT
jgi:exopolyphosphatase / guanosine-5'-triphosphate,3'-diphosphate pyrophosphatase